MNVCFVFAMETEATPLLRDAKVLQEEQFGFARMLQIESEGRPCFVLISGVGKVLAGSALAAATVAHPEIEVFVNVGIGGSLKPDVAPLLSCVIADSFVQHDMDITAFDVPKGYLHGLDIVYLPADPSLAEKLLAAAKEVGVPVAKGRIATGDRFITDKEDKKNLVAAFDPICIDMEGGAYAEIAYVNKLPFAAVRVISDASDHYEEYVANKPKAQELAIAVAKAFLALCA